MVILFFSLLFETMLQGEVFMNSETTLQPVFPELYSILLSWEYIYKQDTLLSGCSC